MELSSFKFLSYFRRELRSSKNEKNPLLKDFLYFGKQSFLDPSLKNFLYLIFKEELPKPENQTKKSALKTFLVFYYITCYIIYTLEL